MVLWRSGLAGDRSLFSSPGVVVVCCDELLVVGRAIARTTFLGGMVMVVVFGWKWRSKVS